MKTIEIRTQEEFDNLPNEFEDFTEIKLLNNKERAIIINFNRKNSVYRLYGSSSSELNGSSNAKLYDSSSARLYGSSSAVLFNSSSAKLYESSSTRLFNLSSAELNDSSSAELNDSSSAVLFNSSSARLFNSSSARLFNSSSARLYESSSTRLFNLSSAVLFSSSSAKLYDSSSAELFNRSNAQVYSLNTKVNAYEYSLVISENEMNINLFDYAYLQDISKELEVTFDGWIDRGYVVTDGIYSKYISHKKLYNGVTLYETDKGFVVKKGETYSHGKSKDEAIADLEYKLSPRKKSAYVDWKLDDVKPKSEMIIAYRVITGACNQGVSEFVNSREIPDVIKVKDVIKMTKNHYGHEEFKEFFKGRR